MGVRLARRAPLAQPELGEAKGKQTPLVVITAGFGAEKQPGIADSLTAAKGANGKSARERFRSNLATLTRGGAAGRAPPLACCMI